MKTGRASHGPPTQAAILAGGRGTRLAPLTDALPKPLIPVHGRPFLAYLLDQLRAQGFERVVLLTGYRGAQIREAIGDGHAFGLRVSYSECPVEAQTGARLRAAAPQLDETFLLMYCDNYWPMPFEAMWRTFAAAGAPAMITVYANRDGYTRSNVAVAHDGAVTTYDPARAASGLNGVDIGYALLQRDVLRHVPPGNVSFEQTVYPALARERALRAFRTEHRYYSIGSHERLPLAEAFLAPQRAIILDRDGVLNVRPPRAQYVQSWEQFQWLPGSVEALRLLKEAGYKLLLITNQPGIARGMMTADDLASIHRRMQDELAASGVALDAIYVCAHGWDEGCWCRKPNPGLLFQAQREWHLDLTNTTFIGDDERDEQAGLAAGCLTALVTPQRSLLDWVHARLRANLERMMA